MTTLLDFRRLNPNWSVTTLDLFQKIRLITLQLPYSSKEQKTIFFDIVTQPTAPTFASILASGLEIFQGRTSFGRWCVNSWQEKFIKF